MREVKIRMFCGHLCYRTYPPLGLYDFFIHHRFYFSYGIGYGYWWRIKLFGKWYKFKKVNKKITEYENKYGTDTK